MRLRASVLQTILLASSPSVFSSESYHFCRSPMSFVGNRTCARSGSGDSVGQHYG